MDVCAISHERLHCFDRKIPNIGVDEALRPKQEDQRAPKEERTLHCVKCGHVITAPTHRTEVLGRHLFTFANPHGMVYRIGCFAQAPGCLPEGPPSTYFTWFPGYSWQIQRCGGCLFHMGWRFQGDDSAFYGLVLEHLVESTQPT